MSRLRVGLLIDSLGGTHVFDDRLPLLRQVGAVNLLGFCGRTDRQSKDHCGGHDF
jgi:hypothetical protein